MDDLGWMICGGLLFFAMVFGAAAWGDHQVHVEKMECMKLRGDWTGRACIFREPRAQ